jgi:hypothetical protein
VNCLRGNPLAGLIFKMGISGGLTSVLENLERQMKYQQFMYVDMQSIILSKSQIRIKNRSPLIRPNSSKRPQVSLLCHSLHTLLLFMHDRILLLIGIIVMDLFLDGNDGFLSEFFVFEHYCNY